MSSYWGDVQSSLNGNSGSTEILRLEAVTKQFEPTVPPAVAQVSLTLVAGDILALLGPSGCGKTTLLRLIAGFERPDIGSIQIAGQPVVSHTHWVTPEQRGVGMVFQDYALFPHLSVWQNVGFGLKQSWRSFSAEQQQRVKTVIALVGLEGFEDRYPHELSGGQQQRVAIARALAPCPKLILLDEPLSNLDVQVRLHLRQEIRTILKAAGTSALFVTHDQEEALSIADQVAVLRLGHLEQIGTPEALYHQPTSRFVASFVTQANFLPARRRGSHWQTEIGSFPLPDSEPCPDGELMVRQEDLHLQPDPCSPIRVGDRQFLGREYRYILNLPSGNRLVARTSSRHCLDIGQPIQVKLSKSALRIFPVEARLNSIPEPITRQQ